LAEGREVILFDGRGISASSGTPRNRMEEMADDIAAVIRALGLTQVSPPDPRFAREQELSWMIGQVLRVLSSSIRRKAKRGSVNHSFLFTRANGAQLSEITSLIAAGVIRPVIDRVFPFALTNEAIAYVEAGRAKGKVVVKVR
jgi:NADPH:quinone reductase-like Zn-dependent oxidoreductase